MSPSPDAPSLSPSLPLSLAPALPRSLSPSPPPLRLTPFFVRSLRHAFEARNIHELGAKIKVRPPGCLTDRAVERSADSERLAARPANAVLTLAARRDASRQSMPRDGVRTSPISSGACSSRNSPTITVIGS